MQGMGFIVIYIVFFATPAEEYAEEIIYQTECFMDSRLCRR